MTSTIETIAVLGAGTMGRGIAHVAALGGYATHLYDTQAGALESAERTIHKNLDKGVELGKVAPENAGGAKANLVLEDDLTTAVGEADLVIEAAPESMELKIELFQEVAQAAPANALF
ncbi:MAG TPA: 3-hydroxyacyl-CoA dehydrogenase NAD-binding domain-containing protein, partial [Thermoanaerobaculia bacterium]|nr:3-hydroxyacyl-CoA dehydrogenase NAD-binding domain-containing protein [Thermoanaerobaculia bacterium]